VRHLERAVGVEQAVVRLEVAMDQRRPLPVQVGHATHLVRGRVRVRVRVRVRARVRVRVRVRARVRARARVRVRVGQAARQLLCELEPPAPREPQQACPVAGRGGGGGGGGGGGNGGGGGGGGGGRSGWASPHGGGGQGGGGRGGGGQGGGSGAEEGVPLVAPPEEERVQGA